MLFDARNIHESPAHPKNEALIDTETLNYVDRKVRRRQRRLLGAQAALLTLTTAISAYWMDVEDNQERQASSEAVVSVHEAPLNPKNDSSAIVFFNGFGTYDADSIAGTFGPGLKQTIDGESWSISYGNAPLNSARLAEKIELMAEERNIDTIDIVGYSAGGVIGIDTAAELSDNPDLTIRSITTVSTPDGIDGLRPHQRKELEFADTLGSIPGAKYSTAVRLAGEVYFMRDRFDSGNPIERIHDFGKTALFATENLQRPKFPGTWLLVDQALAIAEADIASNLELIKENYKTTKPNPTLMYIGTAEPGRDYMVNNEQSSQNICAYARTNAMPCSVHDVPGAIHTMPEKTPEEYTQTFIAAADDLAAGIESAQLRYSSDTFYSQTNRSFRTQLNQAVPLED